MSFKSILPQPATSSGFFASAVQPTHLSGIVSSVMSFLVTFSLVRFKMGNTFTSVAFWLADQSKPIPNPEYLLFRSSGDLKGFIPFPRRSKANSSSFPKTHFSQSGHFPSSAGYSNFPVLHNRKELKFFVNNSTHAKFQKSIFFFLENSFKITFQL